MTIHPKLRISQERYVPTAQETSRSIEIAAKVALSASCLAASFCFFNIYNSMNTCRGISFFDNPLCIVHGIARISTGLAAIPALAAAIMVQGFLIKKI